MDSCQEQATFETTKRLLFHVINEGLARTTIQHSNSCGERWLCLQKDSTPLEESGGQIRVGLGPKAMVNMRDGQVMSIRHPNVLVPPVILVQKTQDSPRSWTELDPGTLFDYMYPWFGNDDGQELRDSIIRDLRNSAANQERWLKIGESQYLDLHSPMIAWEQSLLWGHPTHPVTRKIMSDPLCVFYIPLANTPGRQLHRTCSAQPPLKPVHPEDLYNMINPELTFIRIPCVDVRISGPFKDNLRPVLEKLNIEEPPPDSLIVPTLTQQLPAITARFPNAVPVFSSRCAQAQASLRTVTLQPELEFPYHLKLSLACTITSALRTITPWTTCGGLAVSDLLRKLLPDELWVFREAAAVCGGQEDFNEAKHLSCILREDLELQARSHDEVLIVSGGLAQRSVKDCRSYAERLFGLDTVGKRKNWFREYTACLLNLTLTPLLNHGICLEAHGQNMVCRISRETRTIKGFAIRDFGGLRLHMPTLESQGHRLDNIFPGSAITSHSLHDVWSKAHHAIFQNNLGPLLVALGLEDEGWGIVREEMGKVLKTDNDVASKKLSDFLLRDEMSFKCFIRMKLDGKYRDYVEREIPNILLV